LDGNFETKVKSARHKKTQTPPPISYAFPPFLSSAFETKIESRVYQRGTQNTKRKKMRMCTV